MKSLTYGNGLRLERRHDLDYRRAAQAVGGVQSLAYAYGPAGRLQSATDALDPANNESYGYDALGRLLSAQGRYGSLAYAYDAVGNRVADWRGGAETRHTYDPAGQRLLSLSGARADTLAYDANGKATLAGGTELAYGPDQRLDATRQNGADTARHAYDAFGRRAAKAAPGARVAAYAYGPDGRLLDDRAAAALHAWLDGEPLARIPYAGMAGALYYHNTPSGTPHTATGQDGQVAWRANAEPFGRMSPEGPAVQNLRFPGQWFDAESGLHYNMARYYDTSTGRYLQADPIGLAGGANLYGYVGGDPVGFVDPSGLSGIIVLPGVGPVPVPIMAPASTPTTSADDNADYSPGRGRSGRDNSRSGRFERDLTSPYHNDSDSSSNDAQPASGPLLGNSQNCPPETPSRQKGKRFKSGDDALQQLEEIEQAQRAVRQGKSGQIIDDITKSKQRARNALKPHNIDLDSLDE